MAYLPERRVPVQPERGITWDRDRAVDPPSGRLAALLDPRPRYCPLSGDGDGDVGGRAGPPRGAGGSQRCADDAAAERTAGADPDQGISSPPASLRRGSTLRAHPLAGLRLLSSASPRTGDDPSSRGGRSPRGRSSHPPLRLAPSPGGLQRSPARREQERRCGHRGGHGHRQRWRAPHDDRRSRRRCRDRSRPFHADGRRRCGDLSHRYTRGGARRPARDGLPRRHHL